jgi:hypothetical protein
MIRLRLRNAFDKVLRKEQCCFRKGVLRTLNLLIEKYLSHQTPIVLSLIDYEQAFDSVDRTALVKVSQINTLK